MKTVTINFTGGKPYAVQIPEDGATGLVESLKADPNGVTHLTSDEGLSVLIHRKHITFVEVA